MSTYKTASGILVQQMLKHLADGTPEDQKRVAELIWDGVLKGLGVKPEEKQVEVVEQKSPRIEG